VRWKSIPGPGENHSGTDDPASGVDGKYEEFAATGTEQDKAAMDARKAEGSGRASRRSTALYQSEVSSEAKPVSGYWAVHFACRFDHGTVTLMVALDDQERMAGFRIVRADRDVPYEAPDYVDARAFREERVTVSAGEFPLPGTLAIPKKAGRHPAVVLVHGSGPHDEDETVGANKPFRDLAGGLASREIVVLRYEKRTTSIRRR
jgi:hypothetical protein